MKIKLNKTISIYENDGFNDFIKFNIMEGDKVDLDINNNHNSKLENLTVEIISLHHDTIKFVDDNYFSRTLKISEISKIIKK